MPVPLTLPPGFLLPQPEGGGGGLGLPLAGGGLVQVADSILRNLPPPTVPAFPQLPPLPPLEEWFPPAGGPGGTPLPVPNSLGPWWWFDPNMGLLPQGPPAAGDPQQWGPPAGRPATGAPLPPGVAAWPTGTWDPGGANVWSFSASGTWGVPGPQQGQPRSWSRSWSQPAGVQMWIRPVGGGPLGDPGVVLSNDWDVMVGPAIGGDGASQLDFARVGNWFQGFTVTATVAPVTPGSSAVPFPQPGVGLPDGWAPPFVFPSTPAADPLALPLPQTVPATAPAPPRIAPASVPGPSRPATAPAPAAVPAARPALAPLPPPAPANGVTVTRSGIVPAPTRGRPARTPAGTELVRTPRGDVVVTPVPVPVTMAGIAQEVGRIETKTRLLLEQQGGGGGGLDGLVDQLRQLLDSLQLREALQQLLDQQAGPVESTVYTVRPPCGRGPDGQPLPPVEVPVAASGDMLAAILLRLDALAVLIDEQKQLRGPVCKGRPTGEPVTVTFEQIG